MNENENRRDTKVDWIIRSMLSILDLAFPNEGPEMVCSNCGSKCQIKLDEKARKTKSFLRKRIMDYVHQIEYENSQTKEE